MTKFNDNAFANIKLADVDAKKKPYFDTYSLEWEWD